MPFQQLGLPASLVQNVLKIGYNQPTPIQAQAIPLVRAGRDVLATAPTGTGKTAAFLLPLLERLLEKPQRKTGALILTPTRELAQQIHDAARRFAAGTPLRAAIVIGGAAMQPQVRTLRDGAELLVATPGRLLAHLQDGTASLSSVSMLVLDEADQMFDMGFFPDVKRIISKVPSERQTLLFSATMPDEVVRLSRSMLRNPAQVGVGVCGAAAVGVTHAAYHVPTSRKEALLQHILEQLEKPSVLVFTRTRRGAKRLAQSLYEAGHNVAELHGDRSPAQREQVMRRFREKAFPVLVATNVAARGLDVRHITHVINYDVPASPDEYVHRIGRTGRAGEQGDALIFVAPEESGQLSRIERRLGKAIPRLQLPEFDYGTERRTAKPAKPAKPAKYAKAGRRSAAPKPQQSAYGKRKRMHAARG